jgi:hypothetical protein
MCASQQAWQHLIQSAIASYDYYACLGWQLGEKLKCFVNAFGNGNLRLFVVSRPRATPCMNRADKLPCPSPSRMRVDQNECSHELHFPSLWAYEGDVQTLFLEYARTNNLLQA